MKQTKCIYCGTELECKNKENISEKLVLHHKEYCKKIPESVRIKKIYGDYI